VHHVALVVVAHLVADGGSLLLLTHLLEDAFTVSVTHAVEDSILESFEGRQPEKWVEAQ